MGNKQSNDSKELRIYARNVAIFAAVLIVIGIIMLILNNRAYDEFKNSDDVRDVEAEVVAVHKEDIQKKVYDDREQKTFHYEYARTVYHTDLKFFVNDVEYKEKKDYSNVHSEGDKVTIQVFKNKKGIYKIPKIADDDKKNYKDAEAYLVFGCSFVCFLVVWLLLWLAGPDKSQKKSSKTK